MTEVELILKRSGRTLDDDISETYICPKHRYERTHGWMGVAGCSYHEHSGSCSTLEIVDKRLSERISNGLSISIPVGSGKYTFISL